VNAEQCPATPLERAVHEFLRGEYPTVTLGPSRIEKAYAVVPVSAINTLRWAIDPERPAPRPYIALEPPMKGGRPCIGGTGLLVAMQAEQIWGGWTEEEILSNWPYLTRGDLLVACWYQATNGGRTWRKRWGDWSERMFPLLYRARSDEDFAAIEWPPTLRDGSHG
jgi:uncharacterized protein (DUF433 family)